MTGSLPDRKRRALRRNAAFAHAGADSTAFGAEEQELRWQWWLYACRLYHPGYKIRYLWKAPEDANSDQIKYFFGSCHVLIAHLNTCLVGLATVDIFFHFVSTLLGAMILKLDLYPGGYKSSAGHNSPWIKPCWMQNWYRLIAMNLRVQDQYLDLLGRLVNYHCVVPKCGSLAEKHGWFFVKLRHALEGYNTRSCV